MSQLKRLGKCYNKFMPELPEVETICRQLNKVLAGQRIKSLQGSTLKVIGKRILGVKRRAKMIIIELSGGESLLIHLKMGGVGNIYANEILFCAGIDPRRPANTYGTQVRFLHKCIVRVIKRGIKYGGSTASDENYVNAAGEPGEYQQHFLVYEQEGKKCSRCKGKIIRIKLGGK